LVAAAHGSASALTQGLLAAVRLFPGECHARVKRVLVDFSILHDDGDPIANIKLIADPVKNFVGKEWG